MAITRILVRVGTVVAGAAMLVAAGSAAPAVAAAPSMPANSVDRAVSVQTGPDDEYETMELSDCFAILELFGFTVTRPRQLACLSGALPLVDDARAIAICSGGLVLTGVGIGVAAAACTAARP
jgi:hypothetical protein